MAPPSVAPYRSADDLKNAVIHSETPGRLHTVTTASVKFLTVAELRRIAASLGAPTSWRDDAAAWVVRLTGAYEPVASEHVNTWDYQILSGSSKEPLYADVSGSGVDPHEAAFERLPDHAVSPTGVNSHGSTLNDRSPADEPAP